jgi:hypothetical protein
MMWKTFPKTNLLPHTGVYAEAFKEAELSLERLVEKEFDPAFVFQGNAVTEDWGLYRYMNFTGRPD